MVAKACVAGGDSDFLCGKVCGYLLVKACGFQACQFVAIVRGGESLITAAVNAMASSFIAIRIQPTNENTRNNNNHHNNNLY